MKRGTRGKADYSQDMALVGSQQQWLTWAGIAGLMLLLPLALSATHNLNWVTFTNFTFLTIMAVLGLNVITGMSGQVNLGHATFIMVGGYSLAVLTTQLGWPFWAALVMGVIVTGVAGLLVAALAMRFRGFYVAVATLAFLFIAQYLLRSFEFTGGTFGLIGISQPAIGGLKFTTDVRWYYLLFFFTVVCILASANLTRSRFGRAFFVIRDNSTTAASLGINVPLTRLRAFFIGALFAGLAGGLWTSYVSVVRVDQFTIWDSIWYLGMIIIGGAGSTAGAVLGVIFLRLISQILHVISTSNLLPINSSLSVALTYTIYGLVIILFVSLKPYGIISIWHTMKARYKQWPFGV